MRVFMRVRMRETAITYGAAAAAAKRESVLRNFSACFFAPPPPVFPFFEIKCISGEGRRENEVRRRRGKKKKNGEKTSPSTSSLLPRCLERKIRDLPSSPPPHSALHFWHRAHTLGFPFLSPAQKMPGKKIRLLFFFFEENTGSGGGKRQIRRRLGGGAEGKREGIFFSPSSSNGSSPKRERVGAICPCVVPENFYYCHRCHRHKICE